MKKQNNKLHPYTVAHFGLFEKLSKDQIFAVAISLAAEKEWCNPMGSSAGDRVRNELSLLRNIK